MTPHRIVYESMGLSEYRMFLTCVYLSQTIAGRKQSLYNAIEHSKNGASAAELIPIMMGEVV